MVGKLIVATDESRTRPPRRSLRRADTQNGIDDLELLDAAADRRARTVLPRRAGDLLAGHRHRRLGRRRRTLRRRCARSRRRHVSRPRSHRASSARTASRKIATTKGEIQAKAVITCGGLYADKLARMTKGAQGSEDRAVPRRLSDSQTRKEHLVKGNIYPVPDPEFPFLGVHFTPRMDGTIWLGPECRARVRARRLQLLGHQRARTLGRARRIPASSNWRRSIGKSARARCIAISCAARM